MKKILYGLVVLGALILSFTTLRAQVPQGFSYQGVVRDSRGLVGNRNVGVRISILRGSETGGIVYTDTMTAHTNANGQFSLVIGDGDAFNRIDWTRGPYFLRSEIDPTGGRNYTLTSVEPLLSVPYALRAHAVDSIIHNVQFTETDPVFRSWDKDYYDLVNRPHLFPWYYDSLTHKPVLFSGRYNDLTSKPDLFSGRYHDLTNLPFLFSGSYYDLTNKPTIPLIPRYVSAFSNDARYLTRVSERDPVFSAWNKDYNDLVNRPTIPTVPTNVSAFSNDAGYLTSYTETQELSLGHDTVFLSGGSYVKLPEGFSGDYNDLANAPSIPTVPTTVSTFTNDTGYLTTAEVMRTLAGYGSAIDSLGDSISGRTHRYDSIIARQQEILDSLNRLCLAETITKKSFNAEGATRSTFSVADSRRVQFARGNLQYNAVQGTHATADGRTAPGTWRFAEHQYDVAAKSNENAAEDYDGWIDLFGWGTSGWNSGAEVYQPWDTTSARVKYLGKSLVGNYAYADWSRYNAISNGGNLPGMWRTLTINEWIYLFETRTTSTLGGVANARYALVAIDSTPGYVLFPDVYSHPNGLETPLSINVNTPTAHTTYTACEWLEMEAAGCVFLPIGGFRMKDSLAEAQARTAYWSSNYINTTTRRAMTLDTGRVTSTINVSSANGIAVRPVRFICTTTYGDTTACGIDSFTWHDSTYTTTPATDPTFPYLNAEGCDSIVTLHLTIKPYIEPFDEDGAIQAEFSIGANRQMKFSRGNLQYNAAQGTHATADGGTAQGTWRFAPRQTDCIKEDNRNIDADYDGWIDLFGFGTSGWVGSGADAYQPWSLSSIPSDYYIGNDFDNPMTGAFANADWGVYNAISNGGNQPGMWRTMTMDEWRYLLKDRTASTVNGTANARFIWAMIENQSGLIVFPDAYTHPDGVPLPEQVNNIVRPQSIIRYNACDWDAMEKAGCAFLPDAGARLSNEFLPIEGGTYHSSDHTGIGWKEIPGIYSINGLIEGAYCRGVRLVKDICHSTHRDTLVYTHCHYTWRGVTYNQPSSTPITDTTVKSDGCDSVVRLVLHFLPRNGGYYVDNASASLFSVSNGKRVRFAKGNLTFRNDQDKRHLTVNNDTVKGAWRISNAPYEIVSRSNETVDETSYSTEIQLFNYGTSGWNSGSTYYQPWSRGQDSTQYLDADLTGENAAGDWAYFNSMDITARVPGLWRTLTIDEWKYLLETRECSMACGYSNARYALIKISQTPGIVIFPDEYVHPSDCPEPTTVNRSTNGTYTQYTYPQWKQMEDRGCVFLPLNGYRNSNSEISTTQMKEGRYWSTTKDPNGGYKAMCLRLTNGPSLEYVGVPYSNGLSVRPVMDITEEDSCHTIYTDTTACAYGSFTWHDSTYTEPPATDPYYVHTSAERCDSIVTLRLYLFTQSPFDSNGATRSFFSVDPYRQVHFSRGNLQYNAALGTHATNDGRTAQGTWRFAEDQFDYVGAGNEQASATYDGWIDQFSRGTSGWNSGQGGYEPWDHTSQTYNHDDFTSTNANADWGVFNAISNGGNQPGLWHTLSNIEWRYLLHFREGAHVSNSEHVRFIILSVEGNVGLVLFPDEFIEPSGLPFFYRINEESPDQLDTVTYCQWQLMEDAGCVFLPLSGRLEDGEEKLDGNGAYYYSSTAIDTRNYGIIIGSWRNRPEYLALYNDTAFSSQIGASVRPVIDIHPCPTVYSDTTATAEGCFAWHDKCYLESCEPIHTYTASNGCDSIVTLHLTVTPYDVFNTDGSTHSFFSVADGRRVKFSRGNLQYNAAQGTHATADGGTAQGTWRFAPQQYLFSGSDFVGWAQNYYTQRYSSTLDKWVDLFGRGTSGWNSGATAYQPWDTAGVDYNNNSFTGANVNADWAYYNAISNGGNQPELWRLMTLDEMLYLLYTRPAPTVGGTPNARFAEVSVEGIRGYMLFPDRYTHPASVAVPTGINTTGQATLTAYNACDWADLERNGCVFLPLTGVRYNDIVITFNSLAFYYSSTATNEQGRGMILRRNSMSSDSTMTSNYGGCVRPVMDYDPCLGSTYTGDTTVYAYDSFRWHGVDYTATPTVAPTHTYTSSLGCDSVVTLHLSVFNSQDGFFNNGASTSLFTVSDYGDQVRFSRGNLQYNAAQGTHATLDSSAAKGTWRFAPRQFDYMGTVNENASGTYDGWIDLFAWGTSGWNSGATLYQPWARGVKSDYLHFSLVGAYTNSDWGIYNAISNGGNVPGMWRTLSAPEWGYLLKTRQASQVGDVNNARYALVLIDDVKGYVLFPDVYTHPAGLEVPIDINRSALTPTTYTLAEWHQMQALGCVFLPLAGIEKDRTVRELGEKSRYWSTTFSGVTQQGMCTLLETYKATAGPSDGAYPHRICCVRLVTDYVPQSQCTTSYGDTTATAYDSFEWHGVEYTTTPTVAPTHTYLDANGCDSIVTLHLTVFQPDGNFYDNGATRSQFSVADGHQVRFSRGNLQYYAAQGTHATADGGTAQGSWRFALHQYDTIGINNLYIAPNYDGWIDLFAWGTSGWSGSGTVDYQPWDTSISAAKFIPSGIDTCRSLTGNNAFADWGVYNAIGDNGGDLPQVWRTLSVYEWNHLFNVRQTTWNGVQSQNRYFPATVNNRRGVVIIPDNYTHPSFLPEPSNINTIGNTDYSDNTYSDDVWSKLEAAGCVFLPLSWIRLSNALGTPDAGFALEYWSSSASGLDKGVVLSNVIGNTGGITFIYTPPYYGISVRLVSD